MPPLFDHERLEVYRASLEFVAWSEPVMESISPKPAAIDQLDRASTSVPLNIAEGNGKFSMKDRCRFFEIARGSAVECAACLDVLVAKGRLSTEVAQHGKVQLYSVVNLLVRLIQSCTQRAKSAGGCVGEAEPPPYGTGIEQEQE